MTDLEHDFVAEHAALIGRVAIVWNDLNHIMSHLFGQFSGMPDDKAAAVFFTPKSDSMQRDLLMAVAKIALKPHPEIWQAFKECMDTINACAGERNAAIHTSWAVTFPEPKFVPAANIPVHKALKQDFVAQFESLRAKIGDQFFRLNEVRKAYLKASQQS